MTTNRHNPCIYIQYGEECLRRRHSSPYCCFSLWWISADGTFSPTRNLITMRCFTLRGTFCSLITLATPRQDWTGSNPSRRGVEVVASLSQGRTAAAQCVLFTHKSVPVIFEPPCILTSCGVSSRHPVLQTHVKPSINSVLSLLPHCTNLSQDP